jgi:hypothetical protein
VVVVVCGGVLCSHPGEIVNVLAAIFIPHHAPACTIYKGWTGPSHLQRPPCKLAPWEHLLRPCQQRCSHSDYSLSPINGTYQILFTAITHNNMRIAVGSFKQETNDFSPVPTTRDTFEAWGVLRSNDLTHNPERVRSEPNPLAPLPSCRRHLPARTAHQRT